MISSTKILVGLVSGAFVGLFFGEQACVFKIAADGFLKLLQLMVLPYITISIIRCALRPLGTGKAGRRAQAALVDHAQRAALGGLIADAAVLPLPKLGFPPPPPLD